MCGDICTANLFNFQFCSIKRESFHCQINIIESFVCIYLRHKTNSNFGTQPLWDHLVYCSVLLSSKWKFSWRTNLPLHASSMFIVSAFHLFSTELIALLASFQQFSNDFTICFLMSFQFGTHANPLFILFFFCAGGKFEPVLIDNAYKVVMRLNIKSVSQSDFGSYRCVAKNSLGDTDGTIKLYSK